MRKHYFLTPLILCMTGLVTAPALAQEGEGDTVHILRPMIRADRDQPTLCLETDQSLDRDHPIKTVAHFTIEPKEIQTAASPQPITTVIDGRNICFEGLTHRGAYNLTLDRLQSSHGGRLAETYKLEFTVPDRHPTLAFVGTDVEHGFTVMGERPLKLRTMNANKIHIDLYRVDNPDYLAEAWRLRLQARLAPSEGVYFAKHKANLVWQQDLDPGNHPNQYIEQSINLPAQKSGLFMLLATAPQTESQGKKNTLAPMAVSWFLQSDLTLHAVQGDEGMTLLGEKRKTAEVAPDLAITLYNDNQEIVAHGTTNATGSAFMTWPQTKDKANATYVAVAKDNNGQLAFADINAGRTNPFVIASNDNSSNDPTHPHVSGVGAGPQFTLSTDRSVLPADGAVTLTVKSIDANGMPLPHQVGRINAQWLSNDKPFPDYAGYRFGASTSETVAPSTIAQFVTDATGTAHVKASVPGEKAAALKALHLYADPEAGGAETRHDLILYPRSNDIVVGIKAARADARFMDNTLARFSVIALDSDGHRRALPDARYRIVEDGRYFEWYPVDGRWDYKPLRQERYIAGGSVDIPVNDEAKIEWLVSAGNYRLDILSADGRVITRLPFGAGWNTEDLPMALDGLTLRTDERHNIHYTLPNPAIVTTVISDTRIRKISHELQNKGEHTLVIDSGTNPGSDIKVSVMAEPSHQGGQIHINRNDKTNSAAKMPVIADKKDPASISAQVPESMGTRDLAHAQLTLRNTTAHVQSYKISFAASTGIKFDRQPPSGITLEPAQEKTIDLAMRIAGNNRKAVLTLDLSDDPKHHLVRSWPIDSAADPARWEQDTPHTLTPQQSITLPAGVFIMGHLVAPTFPSLLETLIKTIPYGTQEIAAWLELTTDIKSLLIDSGIITEFRLAEKQQSLIQQLLARQNNDGGFPVGTGHESDLATTTMAVRALDKLTLPEAKGRAAGWMKHYLDNGWFAEGERPARAAAYDVLAQSDSVDISGLHYFADTSDKLPAAAAAHLANAFDALHDRLNTDLWRERAHRHEAEAVAVLIHNPAEDVNRYRKFITSWAGQAQSSLMDQIAFVKTLWTFNQRLGDLSLANLPTATGLSFRNLDTPLNTQNTGMTEIQVASLHNAAAKANQGPALRRRIYETNGIDITDNPAVTAGTTYVMMIEGKMDDDAVKSLIIRDQAHSDFIAISCALPNTIQTGDDLTWLHQQTLSPLQDCRFDDHFLTAHIPAPTGDDATWRIAYLVKARLGGTFMSRLPEVRPYD